MREIEVKYKLHCGVNKCHCSVGLNLQQSTEKLQNNKRHCGVGRNLIQSTEEVQNIQRHCGVGRNLQQCFRRSSE